MRFFSPDTATGGAAEPAREASPLDAGTFTTETTSAENEEPPDFGALAKKMGEGDEQPPETVKPLEPLPDHRVKQEEKKTGRERNADGTYKKSDGDEQFPEFPKETVHKKEEPKPEIKPEVKKEELPKQGEKPEVKDDDADIDAVEARPGSSEKAKDDIRALKEIAKGARKSLREMQGKIKEMESRSAELPEEIKTKLAQAEEDAQFRKMFELENEPKGRAEYNSKLTSAEERILNGLVQDTRLQLPKEDAEKLKQLGFDSEPGLRMINAWLYRIRHEAKDEILANEVASWFQDRSKIVNERKQEIDGLKANQGQYLEKLQEREKGEFTTWGQEADKTLVELAKGHEWANFMPMPENATPEQKVVVEAHNAKVNKDIVPIVNKTVLDVFQRKPAETITAVFDAMRAKFELEPKLASAEAELTSAKARIAELEQLANGVRRVSGLSTAEQAPKGAVQVAPDGLSGAKEASSDDAVDSFLREKGVK